MLVMTLSTLHYAQMLDTCMLAAIFIQRLDLPMMPQATPA
jgi:hypothetical protein